MRRAVLIVAALAMAGCGGDAAPPEEATAPTTPAEPPPVIISVTVETESGLVGHNHDDESCVFAEPEYELRDGAGTIIDVGRWEDAGVSVGPSEWAAVGRVESLDPYRCVLNQALTAPAADIYTLTVTALRAPLLPGDPPAVSESGEVTFRRDEADSVMLEIGR
jgi:hypothetical protein